jgi:hypothetical protein
MRHHAVKGSEILRRDVPVPIAASNADERSLPVYQHCCGPEDRTMPDTLTLNFRIEPECGARRYRKTEID